MPLVFNTSLYLGGIPGSGGVSLDQIIVKSATIPTAGEEYVGAVYQYIGTTDSSYTHGYIYECKQQETNTITFTPNTISVSGTDFMAFLASISTDEDYESIVKGTMTYDLAGDIWQFVGKDAEDNTVLTYQQYTLDFEDAGFTMPADPQDGDVVEFVRATSFTYAWERIDVQPHAEIGRYLSTWNCTTGLAGTNPPESPYVYKTGDYFIVSDVNVGGTNYKPSGTQYVIGTASTTVETSTVNIDDTYLFDGTSWTLLKTSDTGVSIDDTTITKNASDELQASAVINARTGTDVLPIWQGTQQQWTEGVSTDWYNWKSATYTQNFNTSGNPAINNFTLTSTNYPNRSGIVYNMINPPAPQESVEVQLKGYINYNTSTNYPSATTGYGDFSIYGIAPGSGGYPYHCALSLFLGDGLTIKTNSEANTYTILPRTSLVKDQMYWFKVLVTDSQIVASYSTDGSSWTDTTLSVSGLLAAFTNTYIGMSTATSEGYGTYDLLECYVKVDGQNVWTPYIESGINLVYTTEATPTTSSTVYSAPNTASALTITSVGTGTITLSDNNTYSYNSTGNQVTYQSVGEVHPTWLCNINGIGVKVGTTVVADKTDTSTLQTKANLVTSVDSSSTDSQYPSAKLFYDTCGDIETLINNL